MKKIRFYKNEDQMGFEFLPYKLKWGRITKVLGFHLSKFDKPKRKLPLTSMYYVCLTILGYEIIFKIGIWYKNPFYLYCENWQLFKHRLRRLIYKGNDLPF